MSFHSLGKRQSTGRPGGCAFLAALIAVSLGSSCLAQAQAVPSAFREGYSLSAGGSASGDYMQYGERKMVGINAFADMDGRHDFGIEAEASFVLFNQTANVNDTVYSIGPRYHLNPSRKMQPYAKALVGIGEFNFPSYGLAHGSYLVITPGAGVDLRLSRRIWFRAVDFEYQVWPQFTYGVMSNPSISTGIRVRIF